MNRLLLIDYRLNYDRSASLKVLPYNFLFNLAEEQDIEANASALEVLSRFLPLLKTEAYKFVGFTPPQDGDDLLEPTNPIS